MKLSCVFKLGFIGLIKRINFLSFKKPVLKSYTYHDHVHFREHADAFLVDLPKPVIYIKAAPIVVQIKITQIISK